MYSILITRVVQRAGRVGEVPQSPASDGGICKKLSYLTHNKGKTTTNNESLLSTLAFSHILFKIHNGQYQISMSTHITLSIFFCENCTEKGLLYLHTAQ